MSYDEPSSLFLPDIPVMVSEKKEMRMAPHFYCRQGGMMSQSERRWFFVVVEDVVCTNESIDGTDPDESSYIAVRRENIFQCS